MEKKTPINAETLKQHGFVLYKTEPLIYQRDNIYITKIITWQICDDNGYVGNEGHYNSIEQLNKKILEIETN